MRQQLHWRDRMRVLLIFLVLAATGRAGTTNEMAFIPAGTFVMGSNLHEADEAPERRVHLPAFYIDKYEVTHEDYARFLRATGRKPPIDWPGGTFPEGLAKHPVVNVTWHDATAYAAWSGKRLPTEAEWEKACRGTNGATNAPAQAASGEHAKDRTHPEGRTFRVGSFPEDRSPFGVMDMAGNVWEWTADSYQPYPGNAELEIEYGKKFKVIRGGGAIDYYQAAATRRASDRARSLPYGAYDGLGFRCAKDAQ